MELQTLLEEIGLTQKEAQVYLGLLQIGQASVLALARRVGLKRPTIYLILDELIRKGYVATVPREKKKLYIALPPERLSENLEKKREALAALLPQLSALYNIRTAKPAVQLFEGVEGIAHVYRDITSSNEREILSFYSPEFTSKKFDDSFRLFLTMLKQKPYVKSRELIYTENREHFYLVAARKLPNHEARYVTAKHRFFTDNIIWCDRIAIFSFEKECVTVIQSKDVVASFRSLFALAWQSASA